MVNRKDFRPYDNKSSSLSSSDRATIRASKGRTTNRSGVVSDFIDGKKAKTGNESLSTDGKYLKSYNTVIATRQNNGTVLVNQSKYSSTTSTQQSELLKQLKSSKTPYEVTGGKDRGYEGEDYSEEIKEEKQASKEYSELAKKNPEDAKKLNEISREESTHAKELKTLNKNVSFKEKKLNEQQDMLSKEKYGTSYDKLSYTQQQDVTDFLYRTHGMNVEQTEKSKNRFLHFEHRYFEYKNNDVLVSKDSSGDYNVKINGTLQKNSYGNKYEAEESARTLIDTKSKYGNTEFK